MSDEKMIKDEVNQEADKSCAESIIHDGHVLQLFADGNVMVRRLGSQ